MNLAQIALIVLACIETCSCTPYRNVTNDPAFRTDYLLGRIYRLKQDAVQLKDTDESPERPFWNLMAPGRSFAAHLNNVEEVRLHPKEWNGFEIVQAGTLIRFKYLELGKSVDSFYVAAYGEFVDGRHAGDKVNLREISRVDGDTGVFTDSSWLVLASGIGGVGP